MGWWRGGMTGVAAWVAGVVTRCATGGHSGVEATAAEAVVVGAGEES